MEFLLDLGHDFGCTDATSPKWSWVLPTRTASLVWESDIVVDNAGPKLCESPPWGGGSGGLWVLRSRAMWTEGSALPFREAIPAAAWTACRTGGDSGWRVAVAMAGPPHRGPQVPTLNTCSFSPNTVPRGLGFFSDLNSCSERSVCLSWKDLEGPRTRRVGRG